MKEVTVYIADDGKQFETEEECLDYENEQLFSGYRDDIIVLNKKFEPYKNWWEDDSLNYYGLRFNTSAAFYAFQEAHLNESMPWNTHPLYDIPFEFVGTMWIYFDDEWHCLEADLEQAQERYNNYLAYFPRG